MNADEYEVIGDYIIHPTGEISCKHCKFRECKCEEGTFETRVGEDLSESDGDDDSCDSDQLSSSQQRTGKHISSCESEVCKCELNFEEQMHEEGVNTEIWVNENCYSLTSRDVHDIQARSYYTSEKVTQDVKEKSQHIQPENELRDDNCDVADDNIQDGDENDEELFDDDSEYREVAGEVVTETSFEKCGCGNALGHPRGNALDSMTSSEGSELPRDEYELFPEMILEDEVLQEVISPPLVNTPPRYSSSPLDLSTSGIPSEEICVKECGFLFDHPPIFQIFRIRVKEGCYITRGEELTISTNVEIRECDFPVVSAKVVELGNTPWRNNFSTSLYINFGYLNFTESKQLTLKVIVKESARDVFYIPEGAHIANLEIMNL